MGWDEAPTCRGRSVRCLGARGAGGRGGAGRGGRCLHPGGETLPSAVPTHRPWRRKWQKWRQRWRARGTRPSLRPHGRRGGEADRPCSARASAGSAPPRGVVGWRSRIRMVASPHLGPPALGARDRGGVGGRGERERVRPGPEQARGAFKAGITHPGRRRPTHPRRLARESGSGCIERRGFPMPARASPVSGVCMRLAATLPPPPSVQPTPWRRRGERCPACLQRPGDVCDARHGRPRATTREHVNPRRQAASAPAESY